MQVDVEQLQHVGVGTGHTSTVTAWHKVSRVNDGMVETLRSLTGFADVRDVTRLSGGASRETWSFVGGGRRYILQQQRTGSPRDMHVEVSVLEAAHRAGVPVPEVVTSSRGLTGPNPLGEPFMVVEAVEGETIARKILRDGLYGEARSLLATQMGHAMGRLHLMDHTGLEGLDTDDQIDLYKVRLDESGQSQPAFEIAFRWLEQNRPDPQPACLVHGDFRLGNLIVGPEGLRSVLDWELAHVGDPIEDLGWACVRAWRFGSDKPVAGVGGYQQLLDAYAETTGRAVSVETLRWWELLGTVKWGIMCISQAAYHLNHLSRSHELAAIGRRVCENEYDALLMIREMAEAARTGRGSK
jgi:aminoglycoside phosphotransferase (APT) family kinase protein